MIQINISDEPTYGFKRKATWTGLFIPADLTPDPPLAEIATMGSGIILYTIVQYFEAATDEPITIIPPKIVSLTADNTTCVDVNGVIVPCGSPEAVMTEYEYYMQMLTVPVVIADMVTQKIIWADSEGRFN